MTPDTGPRSPRTRHDGWTPARRLAFLDALVVTPHVGLACAQVGLTRQAAYHLRRRDAGFAAAWDRALEGAWRGRQHALLAALPEALRRTLSGLSGSCNPCELPRSAEEPSYGLAG